MTHPPEWWPGERLYGLELHPFDPRAAALGWERAMRRFARGGHWAAASAAAGFAVYWWNEHRREHRRRPSPALGPYRR